MGTILFWISIISVMAFVVISGIATWSKPYNPMIVQYVPWYSWALLVIGVASHIGNEWLTQKNKREDPENSQKFVL